MADTGPGARGPDLTRDVFLGGALTIAQPRVGYRAATDPILLAAATAARPGQTVLELGCGVGVALLALGWRVPGLALTGVERMADYAALARDNALANGITARIECADLTALPEGMKHGFDHVIANPPYYPSSGPAATDAGRDAALREETPLASWLDVALRRLHPGGWLTMIHLADRLPALLMGLEARAGAIAVRPLQARIGRPAGRVLVQARKGARSPFRLLAPLVLHTGDRHERDGDDFTDRAQSILRAGAALDWA